MNILGGKVDWYKAVGNWRKYSNFLVKYLEVNKIENSPRDFNGMAYLNGSAMEKAIVWSDLAMDIVKKPSENAGNILDTKANLLYKLGRKNEALVLEQKALEMNPKSQELQDNLQKMQEGKATW